MSEEQALPLPACRGVWYCCGTANTLPGHGHVYSGPMATYCVWHRPMAIYAPSVDRTFFVYGNADNAPTISCYDHAEASFAAPVVLGSNPDGDAHRNPTLLIDEDGYLYVFYGAHGHQTHVLRSDAPYDFSSWSERACIEDPGTSYPQPWQLRAGEVFVSYRQAPGWRFRISTDGAASWQDPVDLVNFGCPDDASGCAEYSIYAITVAEAGEYPRKVHIAWSRLGGGTPEEIENKHLWARRYNVYYACSDDGGTTWRRSDGTPYELPISEEAAEKIYDCGQHGVWLKDIQLDSEGNPYILFLDAQMETFESQWKVARRVNDGWAFSDVASSDHMYDAGGLVIIGDDDLRIWGPTTASQPIEDGGDIEEWQSTDRGATWENTKHLTSGSTLSHNHVKVVFNHQLGKGDLRVFWSYGDSNSPPATTDVRLYHYGEAGGGPQEISFPNCPRQEVER